MLTLRNVAEVVAFAMRVDPKELQRRSTSRRIVLARRVAALVGLRTVPDARLEEVSAAVGYRNRASIDDARLDPEAVEVADWIAA